MQRLAETIKEFDSHAMTDQEAEQQQIKEDNDTISANMSQGQIFFGAIFQERLREFSCQSCALLEF